MKMPRRHVPRPGARHAGIAIAAALLLALPALPARAGDGTQVGSGWLTGSLEVGGRGSWANGDTSVFQNYRDLSTGPFSNMDLQFEDAEHRYFLRGTGWNMGYDNQRYDLEAGRWGRYKLDLFYGELPVVISKGAATIFSRSNDTTFVLPPGLQSAIQGAGSSAAQAAILQNALNSATSTELSYRWLQGGARGEIHLGEDLDLHASYQIQDKNGSRPFAMGFGNPGGTFITIPAPINEKIHTIDAGVDWLFHGIAFRFDYDGSLFVNDYDSVTASNPLVATSAPGGSSSLGRSSLAPDNQAHSFSLSASTSLPLGFANRVTSSFVYQLRYQDSRFMPVTVNPATSPLVTAQPTKQSLDGWVDVFMGNVLATARPTKDLGLTLRYRIYSFNNRSSSVTVPEHVVNDTGGVVVQDFNSIQESFQRQNLGLEGAYSITDDLTGTLGLSWEHWARSSDREVHGLDEYGPTMKLDWSPVKWGTFRLDYSYRTRQGSDYGTFNYLKKQLGTAEALAEADQSQSVYLRKFDEANRDQHSIGAMARFTPTEATEVTFNGGYDLDDYYDSTLGQVESQSWNTGADFAWQVNSWLRMSAFYTYENSLWKQNQQWRSRTFAPPIVVFNDPVNNWFSNTEDQYHNAGLRLDFEIIPDRLDAEIGYIFDYGRSKQRGNGIAGQNPPPPAGDGGNAVNWPTINSTLHALTSTLSYHFTKQLTFKFQYRYENYRITNFAGTDSPYAPNSNINGSGNISPSLNVFLGDAVRDYQAHIFGLSAIYHF